MSNFTSDAFGDGLLSLSTVRPPGAQLATPALSPIDEDGRKSLDVPADQTPGDDALSAAEGSKPAENDGHGRVAHRRRSSETRIRKLSPKAIHELTASPQSLPLRAMDDDHRFPPLSDAALDAEPPRNMSLPIAGSATVDVATPARSSLQHEKHEMLLPAMAAGDANVTDSARPAGAARAASSPLLQRKQSSSKAAKARPQLSPLRTDDANASRQNSFMRPSTKRDASTSPLPSILPLPPLSLPTYLHLELASSRPSPLYIHRSANADQPYESSSVKFERLMNFLMLPPHLEQVLWFGAIACLDAWLYTFTILPLRFLKASAILVQWAGRNALQEGLDLWTFVRGGLGRVRQRQVSDKEPASRRGSDAWRSQRLHDAPARDAGSTSHMRSVSPSPGRRSRKHSAGFRHRRTRSAPSALLPCHKADILQGLLIITSCTALMYLDASRMYHSIRGQAAIKLYVIYNVLEVFDRLFSALGQDVLECLFSKETLERDLDGRSKVFRPFWMFLLALVYNVLHSTALFYQVVTLNVAVNSYSNALLTLLMSNQFVEIKGTVFKKFEKENLFQLTCADIVERFQLWLMLLIIALRNIVEVGGLTISLSSVFDTSTPTSDAVANVTGLPMISGFVIPKAFTMFPKWTGEVLGPFLIVLGSEALVDWCKHAYITKFNNVKPNIYGRFQDVLAKDYYTHAFADQNLTKRLGLPVIPLSCLFIRALMQTYHMFLATHVPMPMPAAGTALSLNDDAIGTSPATLAALQHIDQAFRRALGRSTFGAGAYGGPASRWWSIDDGIALATMVIFFLAIFLLLLALKLLLGMSLLSYARGRYRGMKDRERQSSETQGRRVGGFGAVEVDADKRRWIYDDDPDGLRDVREKEAARRAKVDKAEMKLDQIDRYTMAAKRIW